MQGWRKCFSTGDGYAFAGADAPTSGAIDVSDVQVPKEIGYFMPPKPTKRFGPMPEDDLVVQTEDVLVDRRGYTYITDKNQGIYILRRQ